VTLFVISAGNEVAHSDFALEKRAVETIPYNSGYTLKHVPVYVFTFVHFPVWQVFLIEKVYGIVFHNLPVKEAQHQGDFWVQ
jgi:hypothetical protein